MRIVITGGAGFLGVRLARAILARDTLTDARGATRRIREVVLLDVADPPDLGDPRVRRFTGDLADPTRDRARADRRTPTRSSIWPPSSAGRPKPTSTSGCA